MRILIATPLYPPDIGGPATYTRLLERYAEPFGHEMVVVSFGSVRKFPSFLRHVVYTWKLFKVSRKIDVVCALDPWSTGVPAFLAAFILRKKFIVRIAGDYAWEQATLKNLNQDSLEDFLKKSDTHPPFIKLFSLVERFIARQAIAIVVPSFYLKKILHSYWGIPNSRIHVVHNGVADLKEPVRRQTLRGLLKFHGKLVVSSGRLIPLKRFDVLIELIPELIKEIPDLKLLIIGDGPDRERLEALVEKLDLDEHVVLAHALEQAVLFRYLKVSDVFVLNSIHETFSHQILEALSVGVPVVAAAVGGNSEIIEDGVSGILVPSGNRSRLRKAIRSVLVDTERARRFVLKGRLRAASFSERASAEKFLGIISRV